MCISLGDYILSPGYAIISAIGTTGCEAAGPVEAVRLRVCGSGNKP